jgi:hypothetical protein
MAQPQELKKLRVHRPKTLSRCNIRRSTTSTTTSASSSTNFLTKQATTSLVLAPVTNSSWREPPNNLIPKLHKSQDEPQTELQIEPREQCQKSELESELARVCKEKEIVLRHMELSAGLTAVKYANAIRDNWNLLRNQTCTKAIPPAIWSLLNDIRYKSADEFYVLPLKELCSNCESNTNTDKTIGVYVPFGGKLWSQVLPRDSPLGRKELRQIKHLISAVLILHLLTLTHQNITKSTIMVDQQHFVPRLIDFQQRLPPPPPPLPLLSDHNQKERLLAADWKALAAVFSETWLENIDLHPPVCAKILTQVISLLANESSDQHALLAWTILANHPLTQR